MPRLTGTILKWVSASFMIMALLLSLPSASTAFGDANGLKSALSQAPKSDQRVNKSSAHKAPKKSVRRSTAKSKTTKKSKRKSVKANGDMSWVKLHSMYPRNFVMNGPREQRRIALTFDDAPDPRFTPAILDVLARYRICATFFVVGERAAKHPELVARMQKEGHIIGNHSYNHAVFSTLSQAQFQKQIWRTDSIIRRITGLSPLLIRPPYGELLPGQVWWGKQNGFMIVNWDVDSEDWKKNPSSAKVMTNIKKTLQPGSIILQHAGGGEGQSLAGTVNALPQLIEMLQGKGYDLVTLPELLQGKAYR